MNNRFCLTITMIHVLSLMALNASQQVITPRHNNNFNAVISSFLRRLQPRCRDRSLALSIAYLHGWSPDNNSHAITGQRNGQLWTFIRWMWKQPGKSNWPTEDTLIWSDYSPDGKICFFQISVRMAKIKLFENGSDEEISSMTFWWNTMTVSTC